MKELRIRGFYCNLTTKKTPQEQADIKIKIFFIQELLEPIVKVKVNDKETTIVKNKETKNSSTFYLPTTEQLHAILQNTHLEYVI